MSLNSEGEWVSNNYEQFSNEELKALLEEKLTKLSEITRQKIETFNNPNYQGLHKKSKEENYDLKDAQYQDLKQKINCIYHEREKEQQQLHSLHAERMEVRRQAEKLEDERMEMRREVEKLEAEKLEIQRMEAERIELHRLEQEKQEEERVRFAAEREQMRILEAERQEIIRLEAERLEEQRLEVERLEMARIEVEKLHAEQLVKAEKLRAEKPEDVPFTNNTVQRTPGAEETIFIENSTGGVTTGTSTQSFATVTTNSSTSLSSTSLELLQPELQSAALASPTPKPLPSSLEESPALPGFENFYRMGNHVSDILLAEGSAIDENSEDTEQDTMKSQSSPDQSTMKSPDQSMKKSPDEIKPIIIATVVGELKKQDDVVDSISSEEIKDSSSSGSSVDKSDVTTSVTTSCSKEVSSMEARSETKSNSMEFAKKSPCSTIATKDDMGSIVADTTKHDMAKDDMANITEKLQSNSPKVSEVSDSPEEGGLIKDSPEEGGLIILDTDGPPTKRTKRDDGGRPLLCENPPPKVTAFLKSMSNVVTATNVATTVVDDENNDSFECRNNENDDSLECSDSLEWESCKVFKAETVNYTENETVESETVESHTVENETVAVKDLVLVKEVFPPKTPGTADDESEPTKSIPTLSPVDDRDASIADRDAVLRQEHDEDLIKEHHLGDKEHHLGDKEMQFLDTGEVQTEGKINSELLFVPGQTLPIQNSSQEQQTQELKNTKEPKKLKLSCSSTSVAVVIDPVVIDPTFIYDSASQESTPANNKGTPTTTDHHGTPKSSTDGTPTPVLVDKSSTVVEIKLNRKPVIDSRPSAAPSNFDSKAINMSSNANGANIPTSNNFIPSNTNIVPQGKTRSRSRGSLGAPTNIAARMKERQEGRQDGRNQDNSNRNTNRNASQHSDKNTDKTGLPPPAPPNANVSSANANGNPTANVSSANTAASGSLVSGLPPPAPSAKQYFRNFSQKIENQHRSALMQAIQDRTKPHEIVSRTRRSTSARKATTRDKRDTHHTRNERRGSCDPTRETQNYDKSHRNRDARESRSESKPHEPHHYDFQPDPRDSTRVQEELNEAHWKIVDKIEGQNNKIEGQKKASYSSRRLFGDKARTPGTTADDGQHRQGRDVVHHNSTSRDAHNHSTSRDARDAHQSTKDGFHSSASGSSSLQYSNAVFRQQYHSQYSSLNGKDSQFGTPGGGATGHHQPGTTPTNQGGGTPGSGPGSGVSSRNLNVTNANAKITNANGNIRGGASFGSTRGKLSPPTLSPPRLPTANLPNFYIGVPALQNNLPGFLSPPASGPVVAAKRATTKGFQQFTGYKARSVSPTAAGLDLTSIVAKGLSKANPKLRQSFDATRGIIAEKTKKENGPLSRRFKSPGLTSMAMGK